MVDLTTAELRWAGPPIFVPAKSPWSKPRLARLANGDVAVTWIDRVGTQDVFVSGRIPAAFDRWPIDVGAGVAHRAADFRNDVHDAVVRPDGRFAVRTERVLSVGYAGTTEHADLGAGFTFGWETGGDGLFIVTGGGDGSWRVLYRSDATPAGVVSDLGEFHIEGFGVPVGCSLADGSFLVAILPDAHGRYPLGLFRARKSTGLDTLAEPPVYPASRHPPKGSRTRTAPEPAPEVIDGKIVAASGMTFVAPRSDGGAWVVTRGRDRLYVYRVDTDDVGRARPLEIPTSNQLLAITPMGSCVVILTRGIDGLDLWITDGVISRRGIGSMERRELGSDRGGSLVSNDAGTSVLVTHSVVGGFRIARADLLAPGDPRLALPAYEEPPAPPPGPPKRSHEHTGVRSRNAWVSALRVWGILDAFEARPAMKFSGDFSAGSAIAEGAGVRASWGAEGVVILEAAARKRKVAPTIDDLLPHLPDELRRLADALPVAPSLNIALWIAADGRTEPEDIGALALFSSQMRDQAIHGRGLFHKVKGLGELAKSLEEASRTSPRILTEDEQKKLLPSPSGQKRTAAELAQVKTALAELGIVWP